MNTTTKQSKPAKRADGSAGTARPITMLEAADEFAIPRATLRRKLLSAGVPIGDGEVYTVAQIHAALMGSLDAERIRETRARADLLELERAEKQRDLVPMAEAEAATTSSLLPIRQRLIALPSEASTRCNPTDPQLAREALERWLADSLPMIRAGMVKAEKGSNAS